MFRTLFAPPLLLATLILTGRTVTQCDRTVPDGLSEIPFSYDLDKPDTVVILDRRLEEVSGLTWLDEDRIAAVNDEDGDLFVIDSRTGRVLQKKKFGDNGDYEALERVDEAVFVLRSDGRLYHIPFWRSDEIDASQIKTGLSKACDAEGLAFDKASDTLLIACKEYAGANRKGMKSIFGFSLSTGVLHEQPRLMINALDSRLTPHEGAISRSVRKLLKMPRFKPSGIAVHPISGAIYVLSSRSYGVAVFSPDGQLSHSSFLDPDLFRQAEGITFAPDGTLFISSEGSSNDGRLARFAYRAPADSPRTGVVEDAG